MSTPKNTLRKLPPCRTARIASEKRILPLSFFVYAQNELKDTAMTTFDRESAVIVSLAELNARIRDTHSEGCKIVLPTLQRGFVWKSYQIENLWDSILRGYTMGAFTVHRSDGSFELLDGQQRATAVTLGFPHMLNTQSSVNKDVPGRYKIFIDLIKPPEKDHRKYFFRTTTYSHPWGNSLQDNTEKLSAAQRCRAMEQYELGREEKYYTAFCEDTAAQRFLPFSAASPIPFSLFLVERASVDQIEDAVRSWQDKTPYALARDQEEMKRLEEYCSSHEYYSIKEIHTAVQENVFYKKSLALLVPAIMESSEEDKDVENMFVRINTAGTPIGGEELNYSLLKQKTGTDTQFKDDIEDACRGIFSPARFITLSYRLFSAWNSKQTPIRGSESTDQVNFDLRIRPAQFAKDISDPQKRKDFVAFIREKILDQKRLEQYRELMLHHPDKNPNGLPHVLFRKLGTQASEIVLLLLYRIIIENDELSGEERKSVLAICLALFFLGKAKGSRGYRKSVEAIKPCLTKFKKTDFWSWQTIERAVVFIESGYDGGFCVPKPSEVEWKVGHGNEKSPFNEFILHSVLWNQDFILYAQRDFLNKYYSSDIWDLDDTNTPYDLDHILPQSYIRYGRNIKQQLKDAYGTIGNLRAWPLELNRRDQDDNLIAKLDPLNEDNFRDESENEDTSRFEKERAFWEGIDAFGIQTAMSKRKAIKELRKNIGAFSICSDHWLDKCKGIYDKYTLKNYAKEALQSILLRSSELYHGWYTDLEMKNFAPEQNELTITNFFRLLEKRVGKLSEPDRDDEAADFLDEGVRRRLGDRFYFSFMDIDGKGKGEALEDGKVAFYIKLDKDEYTSCRRKQKVLEKANVKLFDNDPGYCLYNYFHLITSTEISAEILYHELVEWLETVDELMTFDIKFTKIFLAVLPKAK